MSRSHRIAGLMAMLAALGSAGCFRLTDPYYTFKPLEVGEPDVSAGRSLIYGTIEMPPGLFSSPVDTIYLRQVGPEDERLYWHVTENSLFRAFRRRVLRSGTFVFYLPPGVYELERLESTHWGQATIWTLSEDTRVKSRIYVTTPGVYDMGTLRVSAPDGIFSPYRIEALDDAGSASRRDELKALVRGTGWERFLR